MDIAIIGWYGHENIGDERILYCLKRAFCGHTLSIYGSWDDALAHLDQINRCDYVLIGGGGLILRDTHKYTLLIEQIKQPLSFVGISIESDHPDLYDFFDVMKRKAQHIFVRDSESKKILNDHYKVIVGPDLTFLYPYDIKEEIKHDSCGLNIRPWHYWNFVLNGSYHNFMSKIDIKYPSLKKYYFMPKWDEERAVSTVFKSFKAVEPIPFYFEVNNKNDFTVMSKYFNELAAEYDENTYNNIRYLIGMRFHSILFATQYGIPFLSLSYQPKNSNYLNDADLKDLSVDIYNNSELNTRINYIKYNYKSIRERLIHCRIKYNSEVKYIMKNIVSYITE